MQCVQLYDTTIYRIVFSNISETEAVVTVGAISTNFRAPNRPYTCGLGRSMVEQ